MTSPRSTNPTDNRMNDILNHYDATILYYCTLNNIDWDSVDSIPGMLASEDRAVDRFGVLDQMDDFCGGWFL